MTAAPASLRRRMARARSARETDRHEQAGSLWLRAASISACSIPTITMRSSGGCEGRQRSQQSRRRNSEGDSVGARRKMMALTIRLLRARRPQATRNRAAPGRAGPGRPDLLPTLGRRLPSGSADNATAPLASPCLQYKTAEAAIWPGPLTLNILCQCRRFVKLYGFPKNSSRFPRTSAPAPAKDAALRTLKPPTSDERSGWRIPPRMAPLRKSIAEALDRVVVAEVPALERCCRGGTWTD